MSENGFISAKDVVFAYEPEEGQTPRNVLGGVSMEIRRGVRRLTQKQRAWTPESVRLHPLQSGRSPRTRSTAS